MDRDTLIDLFAPFGTVTVRRMFSGFGVSRDGVTFSLVLRGVVYLRADEATTAAFQAEGSHPFSYQRPGKTITVGSYWALPERLYDEPDDLALWARHAFAAAERAQLRKPRKQAGTTAPARARRASKSGRKR